MRRPKTHLAASVLVLIILAGCAGLAHYNYDDRKTLPPSVESSIGYAALDRHFPVNTTIPEYLFIQSPHDLRTPQALADLEQMAQRVSQVPGRRDGPGHHPPDGRIAGAGQGDISGGQVGNKLGDASKQITDHTGDLNRLPTAPTCWRTSSATCATQVSQAIASVQRSGRRSGICRTIFGGGKTLGEIETPPSFITSMHALGDAIGCERRNIVANNFEWVDPVLKALDASPICDADPGCVSARGQFHRMVNARDNGTLDKMSDLARQLQSTQGLADPGATTVNGLRERTRPPSPAHAHAGHGRRRRHARQGATPAARRQ